MVLPSSEGIDLLWPCGVQNSGPLHFRMGSQPQNGYRDQTAGVTANSKNVSFYGWNIIPCSKATRVATSAQRLRTRIDCRSRNTRHSRLATRSRINLIETSEAPGGKETSDRS